MEMKRMAWHPHPAILPPPRPLSVLLHRDIELTSDSVGEVGSGELDKCFVNQLQNVRRLDLTLIAL